MQINCEPWTESKTIKFGQTELTHALPILKYGFPAYMVRMNTTSVKSLLSGNRYQRPVKSTPATNYRNENEHECRIPVLLYITVDKNNCFRLAAGQHRIYDENCLSWFDVIILVTDKLVDTSIIMGFLNDDKKQTPNDRCFSISELQILGENLEKQHLIQLKNPQEKHGKRGRLDYGQLATLVCRYLPPEKGLPKDTILRKYHKKILSVETNLSQVLSTYRDIFNTLRSLEQKSRLDLTATENCFAVLDAFSSVLKTGRQIKPTEALAKALAFKIGDNGRDTITACRALFMETTKEGIEDVINMRFKKAFNTRKTTIHKGEK